MTDFANQNNVSCCLYCLYYMQLTRCRLLFDARDRRALTGSICVCLHSRLQGCPASRTNLSRPRPPSRGTLLHRLHPSGRLPSPQSRATPGSPAAPRSRPSPPPRVTPRRKSRCRVPKTLPTPSRRSLARLTSTAGRSAARPRDLRGYITERKEREARRAPR